MDVIRNRLRCFGSEFNYRPMNVCDFGDGEEEEECAGIVERFEGFVNGDKSQYEYFRVFFELRSCDILSQLTTPETLFGFLNDVFTRGSDIQQFNSLIIINLILHLKNMDVSFWKNEQFLEHLMEVFGGKNKIWNRLALDVITNVLVAFPDVFQYFVEMGYFRCFCDALDFDGYSQDEMDAHGFYSGLVDAAVDNLSAVVDGKIYAKENLKNLWLISSILTKCDSSNAIKTGLRIMKVILDDGLLVEIDDTGIDFFVKLSYEGGCILSNLFNLLLSFRKSDEIIQRCFKKGLFDSLYEILDSYSCDSSLIYDFFAVIKFPINNSDFEQITFDLLFNGQFQTICSIIKYLYTILEQENIAFIQEMIKNELFSLLENIIRSCENEKILILTLNFISKIINILKNLNICFWNLPNLNGFIDALEELSLNESIRVSEYSEALHNLFVNK